MRGGEVSNSSANSKTVRGQGLKVQIMYKKCIKFSTNKLVMGTALVGRSVETNVQQKWFLKRRNWHSIPIFPNGIPKFSFLLSK